jgi:DNA ligase (NAD+)
LLAGDGMGPAKLEKATQLGVKIISEDDLIAMIGENTSETQTSVPTKASKPSQTTLF